MTDPILDAKRQHLENLHQEYNAAYAQLGATLSEADRLRIKRRIQDLEQQIQQAKSELVQVCRELRPEALSDSFGTSSESLLPQRTFLVPYRKYVVREYVGQREKAYEKELRYRSVVGIWGAAGTGKTWVGAKLAIQWETKGFSFSPHTGSPRQAFWFECEDSMGFYDLVFGVAEFLRWQKEESLWRWLRETPSRVPAAPAIIGRLAELLNQKQYLLCFDDFHRVDADSKVRALFEALEKQLDEASTKVILIGRRDLKVQGIGGRELASMTGADIQKMILAMRKYDKKWLTRTMAAKFVDRLVNLVGANLELMDIVAVNWFRSHTTQAEAEAYLDSLDRSGVARLILERGDDAQAVLLKVLSLLSEWEPLSTIVKIAQSGSKGIAGEEFDQAIKILLDAKLVKEHGGTYRLRSSVQDICRKESVKRYGEMSDLHQEVADIYSERGEWLVAVDHYLEGGVFSAAIQILSEHTFDIIQSGGAERASKQLGEIRKSAKKVKLDPRYVLWERILTSDLEAWLGKLNAAQKAIEIELDRLAQIPKDQRSAYKYEEGRLKARLGTIQAELAKSREERDKAINTLDESRVLMQSYMTDQAYKVLPLLMVLNNLGVAYRMLGEAQKVDRASSFEWAEQSFRACIEMSESYEGIPGVDYTVAWASVGLGQVYDEWDREGDREQAMEVVQKSLQRFQEIDHKSGIGFASCTLGTIYFKLGDYKRAAKYHRQALVIADELDDRQGVILSNGVLAEISIVKRKWSEVNKYIKVAKEILTKAPIPYLTEYVSLLDRWAQGSRLLQKGCLAEGESILHGVWNDFCQKGYDIQVYLVGKVLEEFNCSKPGEAQAPQGEPSVQPEVFTGEMLVSGKIGRYKIEGELGRGAMGIVYKAHDPHIDRFVALKVLQAIPGPHAKELEQRFRREAQVAGTLDHPNIVQVYDADVAQGQWYIVMEYLEGKSLAEVIALEGPQSLNRVKDIVVQICNALAYAHEQHVIHRDIKPSNIMILGNDRVKVADFGLASIASEASLTRTEDFLGTPRYMSPEQIRDSRHVDGRSDIFSLGAVVYELLTGKLLFPGEHITPIYSITGPEPVDLSVLSEVFPDSICQVLEKALAKDANTRFSTCAEFSDAFVHATEGPTTYNTAVIRELLFDAFGDVELIAFCYDHYRSVRESFAVGMDRRQQIQLLIEHCERYNLMPNLLRLVRKHNPTKYARFEGQLRMD